jgi:hypothetical protein
MPDAAPPPASDDALAAALAREADLQDQLREALFAAEAARAARELGLVDEDAAVRLLDRAAVQTGDDGRPVNLPALLADMARKRPWLAGGTAEPATAANPAASRRRLTRDDVRRMTADEINADWDAVQIALRG